MSEVHAPAGEALVGGGEQVDAPVSRRKRAGAIERFAYAGEGTSAGPPLPASALELAARKA